MSMNRKVIGIMGMYALAMMANGMNLPDIIDEKPKQQPKTQPKEEPILRGKFNGIVPKGCKLETIQIRLKWQGYHLTQNVDIVFGSEKAKQKAIVKAEYEIKNYLQKRDFRKHPDSFGEFDQVELYHY